MSCAGPALRRAGAEESPGLLRSRGTYARARCGRDDDCVHGVRWCRAAAAADRRAGARRGRASSDDARRRRRMEHHVRRFRETGRSAGSSPRSASRRKRRRTFGSALSQSASASLLSVSDFFAALGARAALGRLIGPADLAPSSPRVMVISDQVWQTRLGGATDVIGRSVKWPAAAHDRGRARARRGLAARPGCLGASAHGRRLHSA